MKDQYVGCIYQNAHVVWNKWKNLRRPLIYLEPPKIVYVLLEFARHFSFTAIGVFSLYMEYEVWEIAVWSYELGGVWQNNLGGT